MQGCERRLVWDVSGLPVFFFYSIWISKRLGNFLKTCVHSVKIKLQRWVFLTCREGIRLNDNTEIAEDEVAQTGTWKWEHLFIQLGPRVCPIVQPCHVRLCTPHQRGLQRGTATAEENRAILRMFTNLQVTALWVRHNNWTCVCS